MTRAAQMVSSGDYNTNRLDWRWIYSNSVLVESARRTYTNPAAGSVCVVLRLLNVVSEMRSGSVRHVLNCIVLPNGNRSGRFASRLLFDGVLCSGKSALKYCV
jgi:hypothetical protein